MRSHLCLFLCLVVVAAFPSFQPLIPNGDKVPNPCSKTGDLWPGMGHYNIQGGGSINPFGLDFHQNGHVWSGALCKLDSDKDGKTNGEELGDKNCLFDPNKVNNLDKPTGHPGICEPVGSAACTYQNFTCPTVSFF